MEEKILVLYFTRTNSTKKIAEDIAADLTEKHIPCDAFSIEENISFENYKTVILGAPINGMQYAEEFQNFIRDNIETLQTKITFLFAVSYIYHNGRKMWRKAIESSVQKQASEINAVSTGIFNGAIDKPFPGIFKFLFGINKDLPLDNISFDQSREWVDQNIIKQ